MRKPILSPLVCAFVLAGCITVQSTEALKTTFDSGVVAYDAGDYPKAYKIWSTIQDQDLAAMRNVAMMLRTGTGVAKNPKRAEEIYGTAAEAGLPTAQADLADMLLKGEAGPPDPAAALPLLEAAAAADHPVAEYELAQMFEAGVLVPKDLPTARKLYAAAASHGMKEAQNRLDAMGPAPAPAQAQAPADSSVRLMQPAPAAGAPADQSVRLMQPAPTGSSPAAPASPPAEAAPIRPAQP